MAAKKEVSRGKTLGKNQMFAICKTDEPMEIEQGYDDDGAIEKWDETSVIEDFLEENFTHRGCGSGNCNLTKERMQHFSLAEKKVALKAHGYYLARVTFENL